MTPVARSDENLSSLLASGEVFCSATTNFTRWEAKKDWYSLPRLFCPVRLTYYAGSRTPARDNSAPLCTLPDGFHSLLVFLVFLRRPQRLKDGSFDRGTVDFHLLPPCCGNISSNSAGHRADASARDRDWSLPTSWN